MFRFLLILLKSLLALAVICAVTIFVLFFHYSKDLPDYKQLAAYEPPVVSRFYAADGRLLEEYALEHRIFMPIDHIPQQVINAFLAAEDKNFYEHPGVDVYSLTRAILQNVINIRHNKTLVGGSTITQQVVKNFLLTNERSLARKVKEAILSLRISKIYSKNRILELYLNQIYLGSGVYGVASASLNYFNKKLTTLTIEEVAFLAALPKAPSVYDPKKNYDKAKTRRDWVIDRMAEEKFISEADATEAKVKPITLRSRQPFENVKADFFAESVRKEIANIFGNEALYEKGLTVITTLDPQLQIIADKALRNGILNYDRKHGFRKIISHLDRLESWETELKIAESEFVIKPWKVAVILGFKNDKTILGLSDGTKNSILPFKELLWAKPSAKKPSDIFKVGDLIVVEAIKTDKEVYYSLRQIPEVNGGLIVIEPSTGRVLAMSGGYNFNHSKFNRVTQAKRQPGSAFKPFVYLAALESGFTPASIVVDGPIELNQGAGLPTWKPKNYSGDFLGPTTLRIGLEKSRNAMTVRLAQSLGIKKIVQVAKRFGIQDNPPANFSLVLGSGETTLLHLANAYAMLANGGYKVSPQLIEKIQDRHGRVIYRRDKRQCQDCIAESNNSVFGVIPPNLTDTREQVTDPRTAYQMISILEGAVQRGTAASARRLGKTLAGKTGTTNDSKDLWFIGFSPDLVVGTYIGFDNPVSLGAKETGASSALPIFIEFMEEALKNTKPSSFHIPEGITFEKINLETGKPTNAPIGGYIINEAFKTGTEPTLQANDLDETSDEFWQNIDHPNSSPAEGTGGIY